MSKPKFDPGWSAFVRGAKMIGFEHADIYAPGRPKANRMVKAILFAMTERDAKNFWRSRAANPNRKETR